MLDAFAQGTAAIFQPLMQAVLLVSILISLIVGIIPGISGLTATALLLPFIIYLPREVGLVFLLALTGASMTAGSITAILLGVPGTGPNVATVIDGFAMNQKGEGARAMGAAVFASITGGTVPVVFSFLTIPLIVPVVMVFGTPETFMLVLMGISCMSMLGGGSPLKGSISGCLGVLLSLIGFQGLTGAYRFTFGTMYLFDGLPLVVAALGVFGLGEIFDMFLRGQATIAHGKVSARLRDVFQGVKDVIRYRWLWLRSVVIGYIIGLLPGAGASTSVWIAYGQGKALSKNRDQWGTGCVEGVIAPESANNATVSGDLMVTMALGIPGSTIMALLLAGFVLVGINPGPRFMVDHTALAFSLLLGLFWANLVGGAICFFTASYLTRVANIRLDFLIPVILCLVFLGALVATESILSLPVVVVFGLLGVVMKRFGYSRPALILGFVLGNLFETYLLRSLKLFGPTFFMTPISLALLGFIILMAVYPYLNKAISHRLHRRSSGG